MYHAVSARTAEKVMRRCVRCSVKTLLNPGGFADTMIIGARAVSFAAKIFSEDISDGAAVFLEPAACVLRSVRRSGVRNGDLIVVQGAGAMGLLHLLVLRATMPETKVVIIDPIAERRSFAEELGVFKALSPEEVNGLSKSINADAVFDTVGGAKVISIALKMTLAWRNRCSFCSCFRRGNCCDKLK